MRWLDDIIDSVVVSFSKIWELVMDREVWGAANPEIMENRTRLNDCTELIET